MAKKEEDEIVAEAIAEEMEEDLPESEPMVTVKIPKERGNQEDKEVWVNDRYFLIKRGVPVQVPLCVAKVLEREEKMLEYRYEFEAKVQK